MEKEGFALRIPGNFSESGANAITADCAGFRADTSVVKGDPGKGRVRRSTAGLSKDGGVFFAESPSRRVHL